MESPLPQLDKPQMALVLTNMLKPILKRKVVLVPKNFLETRDHWLRRALYETIDDPKHAIMKNIISQTPYSQGDFYNPYRKLAASISKYVP